MTAETRPTLLVVDDEPHMRRLLQFALAKTGARVLLAANGRDALEQARGVTVDLVVVDFMMPDLDGFATLRELRQDPRYTKLPAIMLTSRGQTELRDAAEEVGVDVFLTKPFSPIELTQHVQRLLAIQRGSDSTKAV
jgi:CheY-like chemotaxis protein